MNLLALLTGGVSKVLLQAYQARLDAKNDTERMETDLTIQRLENARDLSLAEAKDRFSATRLGRLLIVVPFGLWWAAIFLDSIFDTPFVVLAIPVSIMDMAKILVPAIVVADVIKARK